MWDVGGLAGPANTDQTDDDEEDGSEIEDLEGGEDIAGLLNGSLHDCQEDVADQRVEVGLVV